MTQDEIVTMARKAGLVRTGDKWVEPARWGVTELVHFAALVRADEREECAQLCETKHFSSPVREFGAKDCAAAIRARGNT